MLHPLCVVQGKPVLAFGNEELPLHVRGLGKEFKSLGEKQLQRTLRIVENQINECVSDRLNVDLEKVAADYGHFLREDDGNGGTIRGVLIKGPVERHVVALC